MRRRQMYALVNSNGVQLVEPPVAPVLTDFTGQPPEKRALVKGECPTCGKVFPRGLHLHTRSCGKQ